MAKGFILLVPASRRDTFHEHLRRDPYFAEPVPQFSHGRAAPLVVLISGEEGLITHYAAGRGGMSAGTGLRRLNLDHAQAFIRPVNIEELVAAVPAKVRIHVSNALANGGMVPEKSFEQMVDALVKMDPALSDAIARYGSSRRTLLGKLGEKEKMALANQKEALSSALQFADISREPLQGWTPKESDSRKSILDGLPQVYLREDQMLIQDMQRFPGLVNTLEGAVAGSARFSDRNTVLDVIIANRTALEEQTGADLIYYNQTHDSFILVQYKAMEQANGETEACYRLPNAKLAEEIERMDAVAKLLGVPAKYEHRSEYRMSNNPFFIKLCPRIVFDPDSAELTPGMYFNLDHWRFMETDDDLVGTRGGRKITYQNAGRYLTNTEFAGIVKNAWVGTTPAQSRMLVELVRELLQTGKSVVLAIKHEEQRSYNSLSDTMF